MNKYENKFNIYLRFIEFFTKDYRIAITDFSCEPYESFQHFTGRWYDIPE